MYLQTIFDAIDNGFERYELGAVGFDYKMSFVQKSAVSHNFFIYSEDQKADVNQYFLGFECMEQVVC